MTALTAIPTVQFDTPVPVAPELDTPVPVAPELNLPVPVEVVNYPSTLWSDAATLLSLGISLLAAWIAWRAYLWAQATWESEGPDLRPKIVYFPGSPGRLSIQTTNVGRSGSYIDLTFLTVRGEDGKGALTKVIKESGRIEPGETFSIEVDISEIRDSVSGWSRSEDEGPSRIGYFRVTVVYGHGKVSEVMEGYELDALNAELASS